MRMERKAKAAVNARGNSRLIWVRATRERSSPTQMRAKSRRLHSHRLAVAFRF